MSKESKLRKQFRPELFVKDIHQVMDRDPAYDYKNVIMDYNSDPGRIQRYLESGWEIVESTSTTKDDRSFTPNSKDEKLRPQPCITRTTDGHEQVLMRILKTQRAENELKKKQTRDQLRLAQSRKDGERIEKRGNEIITTGSEISV